ncbi:MAG: DUF3566 domain-containing protein [Mycobacterium sp.]
MGSPNEPGPPRTSDGTGSANGANGSHDSGPPGGGSPSGDVPPWQRGTARPGPRPPRTGEASAPDAPRVGTSTGHSPGTDARLNRFISGGPASGPVQGPTREAAPTREPAPQREPDAAPPATRTDSGRPEVFASELPDLSGPAPRPVRKPGTERTALEPSARPSAPATRAQAARSQGPVRASMQVRRVDPWSVLKVSLVLSVALFFVWMIAVAFLYLVLGGMGVWSKLNSNVGDLLTSASGSGELVSSGTIFGGATLIGLVNIVLLTAMATCGAFIYNLTTDLVGGVEVTLADRD